MAPVSFLLQPRCPFRLDLTVWVLRRRPHNLGDRGDGNTYRRVLALQGGPVEVAVSPRAPARIPQLLIEARGPGATRK
jgi:DNA-3-methyladenine glycosylase II